MSCLFALNSWALAARSPRSHTISPVTTHNPIIFDFDGTIVDSEPTHGRVLATLFAEHDIAFNPGPHVGLPDVAVIRAVFADHHKQLTDELLKSLIARKCELMAAEIRAGKLHAYPGVIEGIKWFAIERRPMAICSAAFRADITATLTSLGIINCFQVIVSVEDVANPKPDPAPYRLAVARLGATPGSCTAIEDSVAGVTSALNAGCKVLAVGHTTPTEQLAGATRFFRTAAEAIQYLKH